MLWPWGDLLAELGGDSSTRRQGAASAGSPTMTPRPTNPYHERSVPDPPRPAVVRLSIERASAIAVIAAALAAKQYLVEEGVVAATGVDGAVLALQRCRYVTLVVGGAQCLPNIDIRRHFVNSHLTPPV